MTRTAVDGILLGGARIVGDFEPGRLSRGIVVDVEVGALVKAVHQGSDCRLGKVVMDIGIAGVDLVRTISLQC